jgi:hypothetical protein
MCARSYLISLSLAGATAAFGCWLYMGNEDPAKAPAAIPAAVSKVSRPLEKSLALTSSPARKSPASPVTSREIPPARSSPPAANTPVVPPIEAMTPETRAARVEQEANHELRRLVTLLDLDENQQDQVFQKLARNSRYWTPEMQVASPAAGVAGTRAVIPEVAPAPFISGTELPVPDKISAPVESAAPAPVNSPAPAVDSITAAVPEPGATDNSRISDTMSEIMSDLTPEQQLALLESEMDRVAWWAEVLPQILPPEVPAVDGTPPAEPPLYEGSDTLE